MSFILVPNTGDDLQVNSWNWRPTLLLLLNLNAISEEDHELLALHGCGGRVDKEKAEQIANVISTQLKSMNPGERLRADLSVTKEPKKRVTFSPGNMNADEIDSNELYSTTYEWLATFEKFCRSSDGFKVM